MINVTHGMVQIDGTKSVVMGEVMCLIKSFTENVVIPKAGSKEDARTEWNRILDRVFEEVDEW